MKRIVINGRHNEPMEFDWKGDLESTLRAASDYTAKNDITGYFFETANADQEWLKTSGLPVFTDSNGVSLAPNDFAIIE